MITLSHAEILNPDGTLYVDNLREACQQDHYMLKGEGQESYEPHFTFHGFRYVELIGYPGEPDLDTITGKVVHSDTPVTGKLETSDAMVNQLYSNITWGQRGNFLSVPTDCPQRDERLAGQGMRRFLPVQRLTIWMSPGFSANMSGIWWIASSLQVHLRMLRQMQGGFAIKTGIQG